jgi:hypothetical protein
MLTYVLTHSLVDVFSLKITSWLKCVRDVLIVSFNKGNY